MRIAGKYMFLFLCFIALASIVCIAQMSMQGVTVNGVKTSNTYLDQFNLIAAYSSEQGVITNGSSVVMLQDLTGNGYDLRYNTSNTCPTYVAQFGTNTLSAISFNGSQRLRCDALSTNFTGRGPITIVLLAYPTNSAERYACGFGYTVATNAQASQLGYRPASSPATTSGIFVSCDTNSSTIAGGATGPGTNSWAIFAAMENGTQTQSYVNKIKGTLISTSAGTRTFNTFGMGSIFRSNGTAAVSYMGGIGFLGIFRQALNGTQITNVSNYINTNTFYFSTPRNVY